MTRRSSDRVILLQATIPAPSHGFLRGAIARFLASRPEGSHSARLIALVGGAFRPPPGRARIATALTMGLVVHSVFAVAVLAMIAAMYFGMSRSLGTLPWPYALLANAVLIVQFPLVHSLLLTRRGTGVLAKLAPGGYGGTLSTTTYAIIASLQLLALFALWTPSGIIWWQAEGGTLVVMSALYAASWALLMKASFDAGAEVQSGALGWLSMLQKRKPIFPDMPTTGFFRLIRQPIYVAFALTLWTVPVWTPDQLALALTLTAYCLLAPILKERRFEARYGARFSAYKKEVPYAIPSFRKASSDE
ncbi:MAG: isoprenylcysteine carboxylmethyltransferase family protein [Pseudomonadota bacterium]